MNIALDKNGFLLDLDQWNTAVAEQLAASEGVKLNANHWEVIHALRGFYQQYQLSPAMRPLIKHLKLSLQRDDINSMYLLQLFPDSPAKLAAKIAGLPKPDNCL